MPSERTAAAAAERDRDTERRILEAARRVFVRRGTAGARMQEIAEEAGVNQALLHYYFRSKDRLAAMVFREAAGRVLAEVLPLLASDAPLEEKVERFVDCYIDNVRQAPFLPGYVVSELHHQPGRVAELIESAGVAPRVMGQTLLGRLGAQLDAGAAAGTLRPMAPEQFLVSMLGLVIFPFLARPLLGIALGMDDDAFARFLDARRAELPRFILGALRP